MASDRTSGQWVTINGARILLGSPAHKKLLRQIQQRRQRMKDTARGLNEAAYMVQAARLVLTEVSPPGWSGTTKAMKRHKGISNPFALAWWMKNRGAEPHKAPEKKTEAYLYAYALMDGAARLVEAAEDAEAFTDQDVRQEWSRTHPNVAAPVGESTDTGGWVTAVLVGQSAVIVDRKGKSFRIPFTITDDKVVFDDSAAEEVRHKDVWEPVKEAAEVTPPGFEPVVKALKRKPGIENPWAVAWSMKNRGARPSGKDAEAGTSAGAKAGWAARRGGQRFEPKPGGGVRKSKDKAWTPEMVAQQRRRQQGKGKYEITKHGLVPKADIKKSRDPRFRHIPSPDPDFAEAAVPVRATLVIREAAGMSSLPQLGRAGVRVPGRPGSGIVRHDDGSLGRVPVQKGSFHDDLRRKTSLRRVMHPDKQAGTPEGAKKGWQTRKGGGGGVFNKPVDLQKSQNRARKAIQRNAPPRGTSTSIIIDPKKYPGLISAAIKAGVMKAEAVV